ncbi:hypothetical protein SKA25_14585, partial [Enterococcus faecium]
VVCWHFDARYYLHMLPNIEHDIRLALCQLWALGNPAHLQFYAFCLKYSNQPISASNEDMSTITCALYFTFAAKYSAHRVLHALTTLIPVKLLF